MKRRDLLLQPLGLALANSVKAAEQPWTARLLRGGFDTIQWWSGLLISMQPGWKTYWRVPGDGGIAPAFELTGVNVARHRVHYPAPRRFVTPSGTVIGYKEEVVFPIAVVPQNPDQPVTLQLKSFFGVCEDVCIPAPFASKVIFHPAASSAPDQNLISEWQSKVPPIVDQGPVTEVRAISHNGQPAVLIKTSVRVNDMFVEGNPAHYFEAPVIAENSTIVSVKGAKSLDDLRATPVRITLLTDAIALEQVKTVL